MDEKKIGIKVADGTFYPVLEENSLKKKRLILTTVKDGQESVQINLYKGIGADFQDPVYIGSLLIEKIAGDHHKGVPEIELVIGFDDENVLSAKARDVASGEEEFLSVSMKSLDEEPEFDVPEFSLEEDFEEDFEDDALTDDLLTESSLGESETDDSFDRNSLGSNDPEEEPGPVKKSLGPFVIVLLVILSLAILGGLIYFLYDSFTGDFAPKLQAEGGETSAGQLVSESSKNPASPGTKTVETEKITETAKTLDKSGSSPAEEIVSEAEKKATDKNIGRGVWYRIRWGDTLWGISYSFYKSPMLYAKIARENKIKNPDLIFATTRIFIPEE